MALALELVTWWAVTVGVWMVSLSAYSSQDLVVAMACAVPCAVLAAAARRAVRGAWRPPRELWRVLLLLPVAVVTDAARVLVAVWRPRGADRMGFRTTGFARRGRAADIAGRRAMWSVLLSATPGAYVVDIRPDDGTVLLHTVGEPSALERVVAQ